MFDRLIDNLSNKWTHTGNSLPCTVTKVETGNSFFVKKNGTVTEITGIMPQDYTSEENVTLGHGVKLISYYELEDLNKIEANLGTNLKNAVDNKKISAVLTETISGTETIAVIPAGFTISDVTNENTISGGLVVRDGSENEFVWIPIQDINQMAVPVEEGSNNYRGILYDWKTDATGATAFSPSDTYREPANLTGPHKLKNGDSFAFDSQETFNEYGGGTYVDTMYQTEFNEMVESVIKYKGFYVGRYETGGFNSSKIVVKSGETVTKNSNSSNNSISYYTWYKMYQMQKDFTSGNLKLGSSMIWGCQYDQVLKFVNGKTDGEGNTFNVTTVNPERHLSDIAPTGSNLNDKVQNIYDLEGNIYEWALERGSPSYRTLRGGRYYHQNMYAAFFSNSNPPTAFYDFRKPYHALH